MLSQILTKIISYTPAAMKEGSMWWWILPLAPGVPERLVVGHERAFLTWFYDKAMANREAITDAVRIQASYVQQQQQKQYERTQHHVSASKPASRG